MIPLPALQRTAEELMAKAAIEIPDDYLAGLRRCADTEKGDLSAFVIQAMLENYEGIRTIRSLGAERFINREFDKKVKVIIGGGLRVIRMVSLLVGSNGLVTQLLTTTCLVWVGFVLKTDMH